MESNILRHGWRLSYHTNQGSHKGICPRCGQKSLSLYVDFRNNVIAEGLCGRCDNENRCGYHLPPREYFAMNPTERAAHEPPEEAGTSGTSASLTVFRQHTQQAQKRFTPIPMAIINQLERRTAGEFADMTARKEIQRCWLLWYLHLAAQDDTQLSEVLSAYHVGFTLKHGIVYPTINTMGEVTSAKIMWYDEAGHRLKHSSTLHAKLKECGRMAQDSTQRACLFGEHLLTVYPEKPVCVVESEKTALLMALYEPRGLWVATGSLNTLNLIERAPLQGRAVYLYPDMDGVELWTNKAAAMATVSTQVVPWWQGYQVGAKDDIADLYNKLSSKVENI